MGSPGTPSLKRLERAVPAGSLPHPESPHSCRPRPCRKIQREPCSTTPTWRRLATRASKQLPLACDVSAAIFPRESKALAWDSARNSSTASYLPFNGTASLAGSPLQCTHATRTFPDYPCDPGTVLPSAAWKHQAVLFLRAVIAGPESDQCAAGVT